MIRFLQTQGPTKKIILSGILLVICGAMVITFIPGGLTSELTGQPGAGVIAKVAGGEISAEEVRTTARQMAQQDAQRYGEMAGKLMPFLIQQETQRAVEQLISRQALLSEAQRMGLRVTPEEVKDELQHGRYAATFFPGGSFIGQVEYEDMLQRANLTPAKFEEAVGNDILLTKLQALISGSASVSESEIQLCLVEAGRPAQGPASYRRGTEGFLRRSQNDLCELDPGKAKGQVRSRRHGEGRSRRTGHARRPPRLLRSAP
jgi:peptidyl-prolyl cis-trans isomerase D